MKKWLIGLFLFAALFAGYVHVQVKRSYTNPVVYSVSDSSEKIASNLRFVVLSDLHDCLLGEANGDLISLVEAQSPDMILMVGDMLNEDSENADAVIALVEALGKTASVCYAPGNHELAYWKVHEELYEQLEAAGAVVLELSYLDTVIRGTPVRIGGCYDYAFALEENGELEPEIQAFKEAFETEDAYTIMLSHRPDSFIFGNAPEIWDIDMVMSGHDHGGQVVLPIFGGLFGGDQGWFPKYIHGLYEMGGFRLLVTSGLGSQKQILPRFNNPPEVMVLDILQKDAEEE